MDRGRIVSDVDGRPNRMVGITRDVTAERAPERQRETLLRDARAARDEAERQGRLKDEFLATLSHELRTPMTAILGWLSILLTGKAVRDVPSALAIIDRNARLQCQLIEDLLDMNSLIAGKVQLDTRAVDVGAIVREAVQALQPSAAAKQVTVGVSIDRDIQPSPADRRRLQQVLWNLVHNAVKFTSAGGRVEARVEQHNGEVVVTVSDSGRGIAPDFLPYVFDRFRRQDASTTADSHGLGLGLSIVKHLVELHGGKIQAFSDGVGKGATFVLRLPQLDTSIST
jgi:signal transduction histidine kinase